MGHRLVPDRRSTRSGRSGATIVAKPTAGVGSFLGNVVWVILAGWWLAIGHILTGVALCITIIGIPLGIADFKLVPVSLMPLGKEIVSTRGGAFDKTLTGR